MEVTKIEEQGYCKYQVTIEPSRIEKFFGYKGRTLVYKDTGSTYMVGGGSVYMNSEGETLEGGHFISLAIDKHRRKKQF